MHSIDPSNVRRLKSSLFRGFVVELITGFQLGRLIDMVDLVFSSPNNSEHRLTFADLVHYQQRYLDSEIDLVQQMYQLQIVIYEVAPLDIETLERMKAETIERHTVINTELQRHVLSNRVSSITGPNPQREFVAAVSQRLERMRIQHK